MSRDEIFLSSVFAAVVVGTFVLADAFAGDAAHDDMRRVELTLIDHGYAVQGFADTTAPDLAFVDEVVPDGCAGVVRAAFLARLAIVRMMPAKAEYAGDVARATAAAVAKDTGRMACLRGEP